MAIGLPREGRMSLGGYEPCIRNSSLNQRYNTTYRHIGLARVIQMRVKSVKASAVLLVYAGEAE